jgi:hypothetical protein
VNDDAPAAEPQPDGPRPRDPGRLPWVLAALGLIGTLGFGLAWLGARGDDAAGASSGPQTSAVVDAARTFSVALTNFDGKSIDRDFDKVVALSAGDFRAQADQFFSTEVRTQLKAAQASSRGEVRSAYVQTIDDDRATVFVVVDQTIANNKSPQPQADTLRMELGLRSAKDGWLVDRVSVLTAPSGGSTLTGTGSSTTEPKSGG